MSFFLCLNACTIRPTPLAEKLHVASRAGFDGIELWHNELEEYLHRGGTLLDLRNRIDDLGLTVPSTINLKGWFDSVSEKDPAWDDCRRRMEHAVTLGAKCIVAGPPQKKSDWNLGVENYGRLLRLGRQFGIEASMEFLGFVEQVRTLETALKIIRDSPVPGGAIVLDPFHIFRGGGSFDTVRQLLSREISICHFNDAHSRIPRNEQTDADRVLPGDGELPLVEMLRDLLRIGYRGTLSLELFSTDLWKLDPNDVAADGIERMRRMIAAAENSLER